MAHPLDERAALGQRLASARKLAGFTMEGAAKALSDKGYPVSKAAIGAWEKGRNLPDALWLRRLAKLYGSTLDALVWDEAISMEAIRFAAQYDGLTDKQRRAFKAMWLAYFEQSRSDADVEQYLPATPQTEKQH